MRIGRAFGAAAATAAVAVLVTPGAAVAAPVTPDHAVIVCDSASFYENYDSANGPYKKLRTLERGNKVGHTRGAHPVYNGWTASFDFGPNDWGYVREECLGGYGSW